MALPVNIEDLLRKQKVESNRIEFKAGWNPITIYHSICAFANDIDNLGGGYILVGVEENNGTAIRPVKGLKDSELDNIQKEMLRYNQLMEPHYYPKISIEEIDGKNILAIWVPSGLDRPYRVPKDVTARKKEMEFYVRYGSNSIIAKDSLLEDLMDSSNSTPFDERGNANIKLEDISLVQIRDYLAKVGSRLANEAVSMPLADLLEQMDLMTGPSERRLIKNVAAMMFCEHPEKFFPYTQVEIVLFPGGRIKDPNNFREIPKIKGTVPHIIKSTMDFLRTNIVIENIHKPEDDLRSQRHFNYPYQALEEAVCNALYHRSYQEYEPVEIAIEPDVITILSFSGPDRSISMEAIKEAQLLKPRRYRNRRLGEFLHELEFTEGRSTGIPTIQDELKRNGSPKARIETNEERSFFMIDIPCREDMIGAVNLQQDKGDATESSQKMQQKVQQKMQQKILDAIKLNPYITTTKMAEEFEVNRATIHRNLVEMKANGVIRRVGPDKGGHWEIIES